MIENVFAIRGDRSSRFARVIPLHSFDREQLPLTLYDIAFSDKLPFAVSINRMRKSKAILSVDDFMD